MSENIQVSLDNWVCTIVINRPSKKNALTFAMYKAMAEAIEQAERDPKCRMICIKGVQGCFTSGNDIEDFLGRAQHGEMSETLHFMKALSHCEIPVMALVDGLAIGIGTTMLLHCDFVYATESAKFKMPFVNLGLVPEYGSSYILPRQVGQKKAAELLLLGKGFSAEEAKKMGIVTEVYSDDVLETEVQGVIEQLIHLPQGALKASKALMKNDTDDIQLHISDELDVFLERLRSADAIEAFTAFAEKRNPQFNQ